jgi:uroporphyrinogen-III decarboxylase
VSFATDTIDKLDAFQFDDPWDERRYFRGGDNQVAGIGDTFVRDLPPWTDTVRSLHPKIAVYGSVAEGYETLWRVIGMENALTWMGMFPDRVARFVERINEYAIEITKAQIEAADGLLDGMVVWGDVACTGGMLFSPNYWRKHFKPGVAAIIEICHREGFPVIYHGCGNASPIFEDLIEIGLDAYNPLEAKAGLDVVDLRRKLGHRLAFCGNMDVRLWAEGTRDELREAVLTKLNAAKGGGLIFQSDHSVPGNVSGESYDYVVRLVRQHGRYPLDLGDHDIPGL